ncbi:MAG TPA: hypothetical protein VHF58_09165 [Solirubrobacterales bacterium]|nr:hypothetical protein [Solirubrobacterales bacterium]
MEGAPVEGRTLTINTTLSPIMGYGWQRCSPPNPCDGTDPDEPEWVDIKGAVTRNYVLTRADVGNYVRGLVYTITARVIASRRGSAVPFASDRVGPIQPAPPPPPPPAADLPPPVANETANLIPVEGVVLIKLPGSDEFRRLETAEQVPLGSLIDATDGEVKVITATAEGGTQQGWFWAGAFRLDQTGGANLTTTLRLAGPFGNAGGARVGALERKRGGGRRLWGRGRCRCRTEGRNSSGTARGTKWLTVDRKRKTITKVKRGKVVVRDSGAQRTVVVKAGERYVARAGGNGGD